MNLIIPMAGKGKRFIKAGYTTYKPFIPIQKKPMLQYVTDLFPSEVRKFVIVDATLLNGEQTHRIQKDWGCEIISIPSHDLGPAYSIYQARQKLPLDESFFISYCDIFWEWDFKKIAPDLKEDGIIFAHQGFHPHLIQNNFSAFCKPQSENPQYLAEIREKGSFSENWMEEPLSIGVFYIKKGHDMIAGIHDLIEKNIKVANEFFPSLLFNHLVQKNKKILLKKLPFYIHWGVPQQLWDFNRWSEIHHPQKPIPTKLDLPDKQIVVMGGLGKRMQNISAQPKALIPIGKEAMFEFVMNRFPSKSSIIITTSEVAQVLDKQKSPNLMFVLKKQTTSQVETILAAKDLLKNARDFFLTSCDAYGVFDFAQFVSFKNRRKPDAILFTFEPSLTQKKLSSHHTHVSVDGEKVKAVHIKSKSGETDLGFAGFFWVKDGKIFDIPEKSERNPGEEKFVDHLFKDFVENGLDIVHFRLDQYVHLGTPEEFLEFRYWQERKHLFQT